MKCDCGKELASNARICPGCGKRFTHPFVKFLAWCFVAVAVMGLIRAIIGNPNGTPSADTGSGRAAPASSKHSVDDVKLTIDLCGQPSRRTTKPIRDKVGGEGAVLYYKGRNAELHYYRNQTEEEIWAFTASFPMNGDDTLSMPELNQRMGCLKGKLQLPF